MNRPEDRALEDANLETERLRGERDALQAEVERLRADLDTLQDRDALRVENIKLRLELQAAGNKGAQIYNLSVRSANTPRSRAAVKLADSDEPCDGCTFANPKGA